jgi:hypothetical protein
MYLSVDSGDRIQTNFPISQTPLGRNVKTIVPKKEINIELMQYLLIICPSA